MTSALNIKKAKVFIDEIEIEKLVKKYNTPLFVFSEKRLIDNFTLFSKSFKNNYPNTKIYYSIKTNFELQILKSLHQLGSNVEAASALEVIIAQKAGFKGAQIILDGPAWTSDDIFFCIKAGIKTFNIDSLDQLEKVNQVAKRIGKKINISFRIYPEIKLSILKSFIEGYIAKFGVPISSALLAYEKSLQMSHIVPKAISTHIGSMITDPSYYEKTIDKLTQLAHILRHKLNIDIEEINLGGGYGIQSLNYYSLQNVILEKAGIKKYNKAPPIQEFGKRITQRFVHNLKKFNLDKITLILEPGRFIVSDAGVLLTKVVAVKNNWIFLDGGINLIPESIFFVRRGFIVVNKLNLNPESKYTIAGPTLNTADVLSENQKMPKMETGDIVVVLDAGAYSLSRSNQFTMLRPEVLYITKNGKVRFLRRKERPQEFTKSLLV